MSPTYRIYIAAPFPLRGVAQLLMARLELEGFGVTSTWLRADDMPDSDAAARLDFDDIDQADALVLLNPEDWRTDGTGGRHTEFGYAYAKNKALFVVGARTNVFHYLAGVHMVTDPDLLIGRLRTHLLLLESRL